MQQAVVATVAKRVYMRPGETKMLPIYREGIPKEGIVWSQCTLIPDMVWDKDTCSVEIPVTNSLAGAKLFREGEEVGRFEPADIVEEQPVKYQGNMLERTEERLEDREQRLIKFLKGNKKDGEVADFAMNRGFLTLVENDRLRKVVPPSKRKDVFKEAHYGLLAGHFGAKKVLRELSKRLFWESMRRDIMLWSEECRECLCHNGHHALVPPLKPIVTTEPYEVVGMDILEMGPTTDGNRYILAVVDHFSKFAGAYAIPTKSASTVARVFFERWVAEGGRQPKCILSDQGGEFDNKLMQELRALMGIDHVFTKGYNPRENGLTERTLVAANDLLNLRFRCNCGLFGQMAHVAIPGLKHPMARSRKVDDMYQLANVASISEQQCWGDERKEMELRKKNSSYLTPYGLALAIDAHRRRCHPFAERLETAKGVRFDHPAVFSWPVDFNLGEYLTTAISMLDHVEAPCLANNTDHDVFIALPAGFSRVNSEIGYEENVTVYIYSDFSTLAQKLLNTPITRSIIVVWPDQMPESRPMRQLLISLERHLQGGGTLAFFPSPYEDRNEHEWKRMGEVCTEFVRYMTQPSRNFDALVRDHYGDVLEQSPYTHPALCLGTDPRHKRAPFTDRQILLFLEKLRMTVNDVIRLPEFDYASKELKDKRRQEKKVKAKRRQDERKPNYFVIEDPERRRHNRAISFEEPRERHRHTTPTQRHYENPAKRDRRYDSVTRESHGREERSSRDRERRPDPRSLSPHHRESHRRRH
ncbi:integrase core domain protein [Ancylostoma ceylanicum]|uniref:RNA-directed DNA polymerase n=1 Tax=Ancylostoma ceylanicum TaxID=53326 RepID=A0A0D6L759_9BILA|nr:integrase core domain protein [Ancylostoma ceylanicum]